MKIGDPRDESTEFGTLASQEHFQKVAGYLDTVEDEGGKILTGGRR